MRGDLRSSLPLNTCVSKLYYARSYQEDLRTRPGEFLTSQDAPSYNFSNSQDPSPWLEVKDHIREEQKKKAYDPKKSGKSDDHVLKEP